MSGFIPDPVDVPEYVPDPETEADVDTLIFEPGITLGSKYHDAGSCWRLIEAMRRRLIEHECRDETDVQNIGAELAAKRLLEIARTGQHAGTFGGEHMEAAAQAILRCHQKADEAIAGALRIQRKAEEVLKEHMVEKVEKEEKDEYTETCESCGAEVVLTSHPGSRFCGACGNCGLCGSDDDGCYCPYDAEPMEPEETC